MDRCVGILALTLASCSGPSIIVDDDESGGGSDESTMGPSIPPVTTLPVDTGSTTMPEPQTTSVGPGDPTSADESSSSGGVPSCEAGACSIDVLVVIDNSGSMGDEQRFVARGVALLEARLRALGLDAQLMFTTTDFGNPLCTPFEPDDYEPARGAPIDTACTDRLTDFTNLPGTISTPDVCTDTCPNGAAPQGDPFVAFNGEVDNVSDVPEVDIDGDGVPESPVAQAMACLAPMGINGCGYEAQLENMLQALNPSAPWNDGARPFLRPDADILAIAVITDEADCSVKDYAIMSDAAYMEINPSNGTPAASSAICWNAGVTCSGPDAFGVYSDCSALTDEALQPPSRYINYLVNDLRDAQGKQVVMLGVVGVPPVVAHSPDVPFTPVAGGVLDLVYRNWIDGEYPGGDILPDEWSQGVTAADKSFDFGIGPGCTGQDGDGNFTGQAIPPVRLREVCEALDVGTAATDVRCCLESVCDSDYSGAIGCLAGMIESVAAR